MGGVETPTGVAVGERTLFGIDSGGD